MRALVPLLCVLLAGSAAPAAADPCPSGPFIVFFEWQSDALSPESQQILADALKRRGQCGGTRMLVSGHSDTSEQPGTDMARARAVDRWLMRHGIAPDDIRVDALGTSRLRIETGPNIREFQNRRVELIYRPTAIEPLEK